MPDGYPCGHSPPCTCSETIEGMATSDTALEPGARVLITMGRWRHCAGRLLSITETDAVVQLADRQVVLSPSMLTAMDEL